MNEIELWESEIAKSNKSHFFEDTSRAIDFLSESVIMDSKILSEGTFKDIFKSISDKIKVLIDKFIEFVKRILRRIKDKFGKATSEEKRKLREDKANSLMKKNMGKIDTAIHNAVRNCLSENNKDIVKINIDNINKEAMGAEYTLKNIKNFINDIKDNFNADAVESMAKDLDISKEEQDKGYKEAKKDYFFEKIDIHHDLGNNIGTAIKALNKLDEDTDKGMEAFEKYCDSLVKLSTEYQHTSLSVKFDGSKDNEFSKAASKYFNALSVFYANQKDSVSSIAKGLVSQKGVIDQVANLYLKQVKKDNGNKVLSR
jgi:hypothetical protein